MAISSGFGNFYDSVILNSPKLPNSSNECEINFYYYMFGSNIGSLDLKVQYANNTLSKSLWNVSSSQAPNWKFGTLNIGKELGEIETGWKISYSYKPTSYFFYDPVAIDDISFVNCNPNDYLKPVKCDFERDFCGWENQPYNTQFNWTRNKDETDSIETGPPGDQ